MTVKIKYAFQPSLFITIGVIMATVKLQSQLLLMPMAVPLVR